MSRYHSDRVRAGYDLAPCSYRDAERDAHLAVCQIGSEHTFGTYGSVPSGSGAGIGCHMLGTRVIGFRQMSRRVRQRLTDRSRARRTYQRVASRASVQVSSSAYVGIDEFASVQRPRLLVELPRTAR